MNKARNLFERFYSPHSWRGIRPWQRHSLVLLVASVVYISVGIAYMFAQSSPTRDGAHHFALMWLSYKGWGIVFIFSGLLALISSRWPPVSVTWGYTVLTGLSACWSAFYLVSIIAKTTPVSTMSAVMSWGLIAFMWWAISGLVNPSDPPPTVIDNENGDIQQWKSTDT